ncbi:MAG: hypothetical protein JGK31_28870 [Microcoleus sp. PH2017_30_WIL_O_A]|nr:hypothetical protein [Microcoleus sp. PH2017_30_WIL_O_A]
MSSKAWRMLGGRTTMRGRMCDTLEGFINRYFQGNGNLEARVTRLELMAAGILGVYFDSSNKTDSNFSVT